MTLFPMLATARCISAASVLLPALLLASACASPEQRRAKAPPPVDSALFTRMPASYTGIAFVNRVEDTQDRNVFIYRNFYNGGGVAIGDLNGDSLPEVILTANQDGPTLYLNEGEFRFRDITRESKFVDGASWTTGVTLADVNGDGKLDIYVSHAGSGEPATRANTLWINQGVGADGIPTFKEMAREYGVADEGWSTHAAFFDYDRDGDLDLFVINNSPRPVSSFGMRNTRHERDQYGGHHLYRNDGDRFTDVSAEAGTFGPETAFGLGVGVGDINRDGWPDLYVSNDFFERDYLYLNNQDGTFREVLDQAMPVVSYFSMGMDIGDLDNDGWPDIYTTDMMPEDEVRIKTTAMYEGWDIYQTKVQNGYHHQLMRNMMQRNNGDGTFSDVGYLTRTAETDWSWSALIADFDLDGRKDVYVTNGLARDVTSQDYVAFLADKETMSREAGGRRVDFMRLINAMTTTPIPNYAFRNDGDLQFSNQAKAWGLDIPSISSGAAYADLDGDGALDLVVNNVNGESFVFRNNVRAVSPTHNALQVSLTGEGRNPFAVGSRVTVHAGAQAMMQELYPARGFQSSVDYVLTFGLGTAATADSVVVEWPDGRRTVRTSVPANTRQQIVCGDDAYRPDAVVPESPKPLVANVTAAAAIDFVHTENDFVDFDRERLIPKMLSTEGPALAVGDVNRDGLDDVYIGGAKDQAGRLYLQTASGSFRAAPNAAFAVDASSEDVSAVFFDADGDGDRDLYVVSGGNEYSEDSPALQDRLYLNDGSGRFSKAIGALPEALISGGTVAAADFDGDGDIDLFVGGRSVPWRYGADPRTQLLLNNGKGRFADVAGTASPGLERVGMVTDALWHDIDGDRLVDLIIVGEWMPVTIFRNAGNGYLERVQNDVLAHTHGWWNRIIAADLDGDGRSEFVLGNLGLNTRWRASVDEPITMVAKDFDANGFVEPIIGMYNGGKQYPLVLRDDLIKAIPPFKARFLNYKDYALQTMDDVLPPADRQGATIKSLQMLESAVLSRNVTGEYALTPLPREAQLTTLYGLLARDVDGNGTMDLILAGNFDGVKPEIGRLAASEGLVLLGDGKGSFTAVRSAASGFRVPGQTRDIQTVRSWRGERIFVARNNAPPLLFQLSKP